MTSPAAPQEILSATQAARVLGIDTTTFRRHVDRGIAPAPEFESKGGGFFWLPETVEGYASSVEEAA